MTTTLGPSELAQIFNKFGWLLLVPIILIFNGKVISPNLHVIKVI